ncbi:hypothetical protein PoB_006349100 [Plakobranchus ocellatus]|uniref:Uncharacterized protein n=1 Tax=Plakobranchus ocellatus TaxID=259542 RepID=A0AAV4CYH7_9GAST|nr:hypothetical protein PoB_006349100 [Plakobranchus ocellatus]
MSLLTGDRMTESPAGETPSRFTPDAGRVTIRNVRPWLSASIREAGKSAAHELHRFERQEKTLGRQAYSAQMRMLTPLV